MLCQVRLTQLLVLHSGFWHGGSDTARCHWCCCLLLGHCAPHQSNSNLKCNAGALGWLQGSDATAHLDVLALSWHLSSSQLDSRARGAQEERTSRNAHCLL